MLKTKNKHVKLMALLVFIVNPSFGSDINDLDMVTIQPHHPPLSSIIEPDRENDFVPPPPKLRRQSAFYICKALLHKNIPTAYTSKQYQQALSILAEHNIHNPTLQEVHNYITLEKDDPFGTNSTAKKALINSLLKREQPIHARL